MIKRCEAATRETNNPWPHASQRLQHIGTPTLHVIGRHQRKVVKVRVDAGRNRHGKGGPSSVSRVGQDGRNFLPIRARPETPLYDRPGESALLVQPGPRRRRAAAPAAASRETGSSGRREGTVRLAPDRPKKKWSGSADAPTGSRGGTARRGWSETRHRRLRGPATTPVLRSRSATMAGQRAAPRARSAAISRCPLYKAAHSRSCG